MDIRKRLCLVYTAVFLSLFSFKLFSANMPATSGSGLIETLTAKEQAWIRSNPVIKVHNEVDWPPFNYSENGKPLGFSVDYMNLIAKKTGLKVKYVTGPSWSEFLKMMKDGSLDVMLNIVKTPERQEYLLYTPPYADNPNAIVSKKGKSYETIEALFGKKVAVPKGFFTEEVLMKHYPQIELLPVRNTLEAMKAVSFGKADAALGELAVLHHLMSAHMLSDLEVSGEAIMGDLVYSLLNIATRKDLPILVSILSKGLASISVTEKRSIQAKWLDQANVKSNTEKLTDKERQFISDNPVIRFRTRSSVPPFEFVERGQVKGIAVDYVRRISEEFGFKPEFVVDDRPLDEAFREMESGREAFDTILYTVKNPARERRFVFGDSYLAYPSVIVTRKDGPFVSSLKDLAKKKVVVEKGYLTNKWLTRDYPKIGVVNVDHTVDALNMVRKGSADAYVGNMAVANYMINREGMDDLKIAAPSGYNTVTFSFVGPTDLPELPSILSKGLRSIPSDEHSRIQQKWFSFQVVERFDYEKLFYTVVAFMVVVLLMLYRHRSIRKMNDKLELSYKEIEEKNRLLEELAVTDNLTKLYNRNKLDEVLITESNRSNRYASMFGVIMLDIDNFKRVNDVHGHQIGDKILQEFADILKSHSRKSDIVGRWGGEEFLIVCCETSEDGIRAFSENLREKIATFPFTLGEQKTASLGVSLFQKGEDIRDLLKRADNALYKAKESGRNRVEIL